MNFKIIINQKYITTIQMTENIKEGKKMKEYLVCHVDGRGQLKKARRLTDEEKKQYVEEFRNRAFVGIRGESIDLKYLMFNEILNYLDRESDGQFTGSSGNVYIITQDEWDELVQMDSAKAKIAKRKELEENIVSWEKIVQSCEAIKASGNLYSTKEDAQKAKKKYNDFYNEGGDGYVPHFWTVEEYEDAKTKLTELQEELNKM